jgi:hypothetical protein
MTPRLAQLVRARGANKGVRRASTTERRPAPCPAQQRLIPLSPRGATPQPQTAPLCDSLLLQTVLQRLVLATTCPRNADGASRGALCELCAQQQRAQRAESGSQHAPDFSPGAVFGTHAPRTRASHFLSASALVSLSRASDSRFDSAEEEDMAGAAAAVGGESGLRREQGRLSGDASALCDKRKARCG